MAALPQLDWPGSLSVDTLAEAVSVHTHMSTSVEWPGAAPLNGP